MDISHADKESLQYENGAHEHFENEKHVEVPQKIHWGFRQIMAIISLCILWVGSQIPLYFTGGMLSYMVQDLGGEATAAAVWIPVCNTLAVAAVAPFSGYLQDLVGRRMITLAGSLAIMVGIILAATAHSFGQGVAGMAIAGAGAGIGELTALSGVAELVPVKYRGASTALVVAFLLPFTPYVLYCQLLSTRTSLGWRWCFWISLIYNGIAFIGMLLFYFPERELAIQREGKMKILKSIDWVGAALSITGITLFLVSIQAGGYTHPWTSAYVLSMLIIGIFLIIGFLVWEWKFAKLPMVPRELFRGQRTIGVTFLLVFVAGMNFYSLINFFPLTFSDVYTPDPVQVGLKGLGYGISVTAGAMVVNFLLSVFKNHNRELMIVSAVIMTAFTGALVCVNPDNPKTAVAIGTIAGFGVGGVLVPPATIAITVCADNLIATVVALNLSVRVIGGSIGYAIYYNIFVQKLTAALPEYIVTYAITAGLPPASAVDFVTALLTAPGTVQNIGGVTPAVLAAATRGSREAYAYSLTFVWYTSIAFGVIAIIAAAFLGNNRKYLTDRVAAKIRS